MQNILPKFSLIPLLFSPLFGIIDFPAIKFAMMSGGEDEDNAVPLVAFLLISVGLDTFFVLLGFNSSNEETTIAFLMMVYGSMIALLFMVVLLGVPEDEEPLPFMNNPGWLGAGLGVFLGFIVLLINAVATSFGHLSLVPSGLGFLKGIQYNSMLFVPQFFSTAQVGTQSVLDNTVFELFLTAAGEEGLKAALLYGMYLLTKSEAISVTFSTGTWAGFHTILVHFSWQQVLLAFVSGLIWYVSWKKTGSLLTPILAHFTYDGSIVVLSSA